MTEKINAQKEKLHRERSRTGVRLLGAVMAALITLSAASVATFAWYIYNTNAHTTKVHMAAGTSTKLEISKGYNGTYSYSVDLDSFFGTLNPVSTDKITGGFQKVYGYTDGSDTQPRLASIFRPAESNDYFSTTLYLRTNAAKQGVYVSLIDYDHNVSSDLMATAMRVGLVVHEPGENKQVAGEYIFSLSDEQNPNREYNTYNGEEGCVLDHTKTDGSVVRLTPYDRDNYATYDAKTGLMNRTDKSLKLFELTGGREYAPGEAVQVDVYVWLEGCDSDCTGYLGKLNLKNLAISFVGYDE